MGRFIDNPDGSFNFYPEGKPMTEEEFEEAWRRMEAADEKKEKEWEALPEEEKQAILNSYEYNLVERMRAEFSYDDDEDEGED